MESLIPLVGGGVATVLTLVILSRVISDHALYRLAQHLFIGLALGYVGAVMLRGTVITPATRLALGQASSTETIVVGVSALLLVLLATRFRKQRLSRLANYPLSLLFGVGAALAVVGAVRGTLVPQIFDTVRLRGLEHGAWVVATGAAVVAALTILTLVGFMYRTRPEGLSILGRLTVATSRTFILVTFGIFFAASVTTYVAALTGQIAAIINWIKLLLGAA